MDRYSKIILGVLIVLVVFSVVATYYRVFINEDYVISAQISCDFQTESCFVVPADEGEGETSYYKIIKKKAANIPFCNPHVGECPELSCEQGEIDCEVINCDATKLSDGESCSTIPSPPNPESDLPK